MPELPEVEAARALVEHWCQGKTISKATVQVDEKVIEGIPAAELQRNLVGKVVTGAGRKAKHLWLELGKGGAPALYLHFGMTGGIIIRAPDGSLTTAKYERIDPDLSGAWPPRFTKLDFELADGTCLAFTDSRRFAKVKWLTEPAMTIEPVSKLAPDALTQMPTLEDFENAIKGMSRKKALKIKALLLDQEGLVSGVGNWVADEVLYQAKVHPEQTVLSLSPEQLSAIHTSLRSVIKHAVSVDADSARFPRTWLFHYRWTGKKAGVDANGHVIDFVTVGSRTSAYVPSLQKLTETVIEVTTTTTTATTKRARKAGTQPKKKKGRGTTGDAQDTDNRGVLASEGGKHAEEPGRGFDSEEVVEVKPQAKTRGRKKADTTGSDEGPNKKARVARGSRAKQAEVEVEAGVDEQPAPAAKPKRGRTKQAPVQEEQERKPAAKGRRKKAGAATDTDAS